MFLEAKSKIQHNGKTYLAGDIIECSDSQGKQLISIGVAVENKKQLSKLKEEGKDKVETKTKSTKKRRKVKI